MRTMKIKICECCRKPITIKVRKNTRFHPECKPKCKGWGGKCKACGKKAALSPKGKITLYCKKCRKKLFSKGQHAYNKICHNGKCKKPFISKSYNAKYCCNRCKEIGHKERHAKYYTALKARWAAEKYREIHIAASLPLQEYKIHLPELSRRFTMEDIE